MASTASPRVVDVAITAGIVIAGLSLLVQTTGHSIWAFVSPLEVLNADSDASAFAWASSSVIFAGAVASAGLGLTVPGQRGSWLALSATLALLSLDDLIAVHERLGGLADRLDLWAHANRAVGMALIGPLLAVAFLLVWRASRLAEPRARRPLRVGLGLLVAATFLEVVVSQLVRRAGFTGPDLPYLTEVLVEESLELVGWVLVVTGLIAILFSCLIAIGQRSATERSAPSLARRS